MEEGDFKTKIEMVEGYKFRIHFDNEKAEDIYMDEPKPLGTGDYPNAGKFLAAAVGNCLCASLAYCVRRHRAEVFSLRAEVYTTLARNEGGRFRITHITVKLHPGGVRPDRFGQVPGHLRGLLHRDGQRQKGGAGRRRARWDSHQGPYGFIIWKGGL